MYSDKTERRPRLRRYLLTALLIAAAVLLVRAAAPGKDLGESSAAAIRAAVEDGARQCYVVEGIYPPDLAYLEQNYGLQINKKDFYVTYDAYASNLPPTVKVTARR